jgi:hypothetical protein
MENALEQSARSTGPTSTRALWIGRILSGLVIAFLALDAAMKLVPIAPVIESCKHLGWAPELARPLGVLLGACTLVHAIPRTRFLGALLLTAYLGAGTATLVRVGDVFVFPVIMGALLWLGLALREPRLRALVAGAAS